MNFPNDYAERRAHYLDGITAQAMRNAAAIVDIRERLRKPYPHAKQHDELLAKRDFRMALLNCKRAVIEIADRIITNATPRSPEEIARMWPTSTGAFHERLC